MLAGTGKIKEPIARERAKRLQKRRFEKKPRQMKRKGKSKAKLRQSP
jgi:hypothetical protein